MKEPSKKVTHSPPSISVRIDNTLVGDLDDLSRREIDRFLADVQFGDRKRVRFENTERSDLLEVTWRDLDGFRIHARIDGTELRDSLLFPQRPTVLGIIREFAAGGGALPDQFGFVEASQGWTRKDACRWLLLGGRVSPVLILLVFLVDDIDFLSGAILVILIGIGHVSWAFPTSRYYRNLKSSPSHANLPVQGWDIPAPTVVMIGLLWILTGFVTLVFYILS